MQIVRRFRYAILLLILYAVFCTVAGVLVPMQACGHLGDR